ncbi:ROK family protein [Fusobacterium necrophorum]|uniref:ROK family protein n=1 Tax=Fusobacterium necrophorum TaxID=859 RepID=A0A4V1QXM6_9FUSO|nr:ROK family protein [Fusobacterium necrophorum]RXZ70186.1 ROK family protein [Fusobacterium necrophorum]
MYQKEIKKNNETIIFEYIYNRKQGFSIAEVCQSLNLTFPTVKRILEDFLEKDMLIQSKKHSHGVGRKGMEYTYNHDFCYSIGVRISEEYIYLIFTDSVGKALCHSKVKLSSPPKDMISFLESTIYLFIQQIKKEKREKIVGIGISIPGIFNQETKMIEFKINHFSSFVALQELQKNIPYPIYIENESNLSAIAEAVLGKCLNLSEFTVLTINKNIGSSHFARREQDRNFYLKAGRIHHMIVHQHGRKCYCGSKGCLGSYISIKALLQDVQEVFPEITEIKTFFRDEYRETEEGKKILDQYLEYLAAGIQNLLFLSNPEKIIISGMICDFQDYLYTKLLDKIYHSGHIFFRGRDTVVFSSFQENSSLIGAALFPIVDSMF